MGLLLEPSQGAPSPPGAMVYATPHSFERVQSTSDRPLPAPAAAAGRTLRNHRAVNAGERPLQYFPSSTTQLPSNVPRRR